MARGLVAGFCWRSVLSFSGWSVHVRCYMKFPFRKLPELCHFFHVAGAHVLTHTDSGLVVVLVVSEMAHKTSRTVCLQAYTPSSPTSGQSLFPLGFIASLLLFTSFMSSLWSRSQCRFLQEGSEHWRTMYRNFQTKRRYFLPQIWPLHCIVRSALPVIKVGMHAFLKAWC